MYGRCTGRRLVRTEAGRSLKGKLQEFKQEMTVVWTPWRHL